MAGIPQINFTTRKKYFKKSKQQGGEQSRHCRKQREIYMAKVRTIKTDNADFINISVNLQLFYDVLPNLSDKIMTIKTTKNYTNLSVLKHYIYLKPKNSE